jgi:hypothetical protein
MKTKKEREREKKGKEWQKGFKVLEQHCMGAFKFYLV